MLPCSCNYLLQSTSTQLSPLTRFVAGSLACYGPVPVRTTHCCHLPCSPPLLTRRIARVAVQSQVPTLKAAVVQRRRAAQAHHNVAVRLGCLLAGIVCCDEVWRALRAAFVVAGCIPPAHWALYRSLPVKPIPCPCDTRLDAGESLAAVGVLHKVGGAVAQAQVCVHAGRAPGQRENDTRPSLRTL